jgi:hypothetical protein
MSEENDAVEQEVDPTVEDVVNETSTEGEAEAQGESSPPEVNTQIDTAQDKIQERINEITRQKYEEKRRADELQRQLDAANANKQQVPKEEPTLEQFDYDEDKLNQARIERQVAIQLEKERQQQALQTQQAQRNQEAAKFSAKEAEYSKKHENYLESIKNLPQLHPETLSALYAMENGPEIAHYLGEHLDIADNVATSNPVLAAVELGKISAVLSSSNRKIKVSKAPAPVKTLSGQSTVGKNMEDMSMEEIMAMDN